MLMVSNQIVIILLSSPNKRLCVFSESVKVTKIVVTLLIINAFGRCKKKKEKSHKGSHSTYSFERASEERMRRTILHTANHFRAILYGLMYNDVAYIGKML